VSDPHTGREDPAPGPAPETIRLAAIHVSGVRTISPGERELELRFSETGLEILSTPTGAPVGRLGWEEIRSVTLPRTRRSLRRRGAPRLVVTTASGRATFELPGFTSEQLEEHLAPMLDRPPGSSLAG
jgi:hypothetical protein